MSEQTFNLNAVLKAYDKGFSSGMRKAQGTLGKTEKVATSLGGTIKSGLGFGVLMGIGTKAVNTVSSAITNNLGGAIKRFDTLNNFPKIMQNLGYSSIDAKKSIDKMSEGIDGLPTALDDIAGAAQKIAPLTGNLSKATDVTLAFNDALLAGGKDTAAQANALEQYSQMLANGKVDMQSWKSMMNAMPGQLNQVAESLLGTGKNGMELYEAMKNGKVSFDDFNNALLKLDKQGLKKGGKSFASFKKQAKDATQGVGTAVQNFKNRITKGLTSVIETADKRFHFADSINNMSSGIKKAMEKFAKSDTFAKIVNGIKGFIKGVKPVLSAFGSAFSKVFGSIVDKLSNSSTGVSILTKLRNALMDIAWFIEDHADQIADFAVNVLPKLWLAFKGAEIVKGVGSSLMGFGKVFSPLASKFSGFFSKLGPIGIGIGAFTALGVATDAYNRHLANTVANQYGLTDAQKQLNREIEETTRDRKKSTEETQNTLGGISEEYGYLEDLVDEYDKLVDKNGEVKDKYKDRADFIKNELAEKLGMERKDIDKLIGKNGKLKDAIQKVIDKKKAMAYLDAYKEDYTKAIKNRKKYMQQVYDAQKEVEKAEKKQKEGEENIEKWQKQIKNLRKTPVSDEFSYNKRNDDIRLLQLKIKKTKKAIEDGTSEAKDALKKAQQNLKKPFEDIFNYENLETAINSGNTKKMQEAMDLMSSGIVTASNATAKKLKKQLSDYKDMLEYFKEEHKKHPEKVTQAMVDYAQKMVDRAQKEVDKKTPSKVTKKVKVETKVKTKDDTKKVSEKVRNSSNKTNETVKKTLKETQSIFSKPVSIKYNLKKKAGRDKLADDVAGAVSRTLTATNTYLTKQKKDKLKPAGGATVFGFIRGIAEKLGLVQTASAKMPSKAKKGAEKAKKKGTSRGSEFGEGFFNGIGSWFRSVFDKAFGLAEQADSGAKKGQQSGSPSRKAKKRGREFVQGYALGIAKGFKTIASTAKNLTNQMFGSLKMPMVRGQALNAWNQNFGDKVTSAMEKFRNKLDNVASKLKQKYVETFDINEIERAMHSKSKSAWNKAVQKIFGTKEMTDAQRTGLENMQRKYEDRLTKAVERMSEVAEERLGKLADKYQKKYDEITSARETFESSLKGKSSLYTTDSYGFFEFTDWSKNIKEINKVETNLKKLQKWGANQDFINAVSSMSIDDQLFYTDKLISSGKQMAQAQFKGYTSYMTRAENASKSIYKPYVNALDVAYNKELRTVLSSLEKKMIDIGKSVGKGLINGLGGKFITRQLKAWSKNASNTIIQTLRKTLGIHSPSKVMNNLGVMTGKGLIKGIDRMQQSVRNATENLIAIPQLAMANAPVMEGAYTAGYSTQSNYTIEVPLFVNGKEFARATATDMDKEITKRRTQINRNRGIL